MSSIFYYHECLENLLGEVIEKAEETEMSQDEEEVVEKLTKTLSVSKMLLEILDKYWEDNSSMSEEDFKMAYKQVLLDYATLTNTQVRKDKHILI